MTRPSESLTAAVGSIVGAVLIILGATGLEITPEVSGAIVVLVSWIAFAVTWWVARKQAAGDLGSGPTGQVTPSP